MVLRIKEREEAIQLLAMDPQVCGKLLTLHRKGNGVDVEALRDRIPLRQDAKKAPRWDLMGTEGCGGGKVFSWLSWQVLEYLRIYRRKKQVGGVTRGPQGWGARPPSLWSPRDFSDLHFKSSGCLLVQEKSSRKFHSIWTPFDIDFLENQKEGKNSN